MLDISLKYFTKNFRTQPNIHVKCQINSACFTVDYNPLIRKMNDDVHIYHLSFILLKATITNIRSRVRRRRALTIQSSM